MSRRNLVLSVCLSSAILILQLLIRRQDRGLELTHCRMRGQYETPLLRISPGSLRSKDQQRRAENDESSIERPRSRRIADHTGPVALLIHGLSASKSAMIHLGSELALCGVECYLMDLPGHGESVERFSLAACGPAIREVIEELRSNRRDQSKPDIGETSPPLVLVGHSLGAGLALGAGKVDPTVTGVIAVSPAGEPIDRAHPKNVLVILGDYDLPAARKAASFIFEQGTGITPPPLNSPGIWSNPEASRRLVVLAWADHTTGIFRWDSIWHMVNWLEGLFSGAIIRQQPGPIRFLLRVFFCCSMVLLFLPAFELIADFVSFLSHRFSFQPGNTPLCVTTLRREPEAPARGFCKIWSLQSGIASLWIYGIAASLAALILLAWNPWARLGLMGGGYLSGFLCLTGFLALGLHRPPIDALRISLEELLCLCLSLLFLLFVVAPALSQNIFHVGLSHHRLWRLPWVILSVFPFYLFDEWICRNVRPLLGSTRFFLFHFSTRLILTLVLLLGFFVLQNNELLIVLILPGLLGLSVLCGCFSRWIFRRIPNITSIALFGALMTGWFFTTFFVQV